MAAADEEENMNKKAVFFDIDGTLYDHETGISDSTKEGIARLKENGHYAFICTGRSMAAVFDPELLGMGFDGIVAGCGTYVKLGEELLLNAEISQEKLCGLLDLLQAHRIIPVLEGCDYLYYHRKDYEIGDTDLYIRSLKKYIPDRLVEIEDHEGDLPCEQIQYPVSGSCAAAGGTGAAGRGLLYSALLRAPDGAHSAGPHESHRHGRGVQPPVY